MEFHYNTSGKLREIFTKHCNLSVEQYMEISGQFLYLVTDIREGKPQAEIERRMDYMRAVFEFLCKTKEVTLQEDFELNKLLDDVWNTAKKTAVMLAGREGTIL